jgi:hypothetical protein
MRYFKGVSVSVNTGGMAKPQLPRCVLVTMVNLRHHLSIFFSWFVRLSYLWVSNHILGI